ncbi:ATP-dependent nuclease [Porphyromonas gingivalis]|uniref:ATP-dependent nuclease n=1 Tax=Porphyromonas gingivalis TaxID=837 RepID=UPI000974F7CC|nr:AAA family ATPase [Porphyromonas gingivalis]SJL21204.1 recombination protein F [Porphyromonas gingivalis]SJM18990.1 recombination protein F [Porphyromonas gingivalis]
MYLSKIHIKNFRGIKNLEVEFDKKLNVIIGANGQLKTSLMDAIRLFYSWGEPNRDIEITKEDFYVEIAQNEDGKTTITPSTKIDIVYLFDGLSEQQEGAFYQYLYKKKDGTMAARVHLSFEMKEKGRIYSSYITGKEENGLRADWNTFHYFHPYYLGALRDSTRDLMSTRNNLLGRVIKRKIDRAGSEDDVKSIVDIANDQLLQRQEVTETQTGINHNLNQINRFDLQDVKLHIEQNRIEYIVNIIKPFLPYSATDKRGFVLTQNSLGYNNLIYIASILSDIKDCHSDDNVSVYGLLIEEPEAHLHPQLQVNLYNFLKNADDSENSQTFITTHSPTLTSKIPLENLILLKNNEAYHVGNCYKDRHTEKIIRDAAHKRLLKEEEVIAYRKMIARYFDVTRSQLLFSNGCVFLEGISECQLIETFSNLMGKSLIDHQIEIVDTDGTAFYQFLMLFNSSEAKKRLPMLAAFITDEDQFTESKKTEYNLDALIENDYENLRALREGINNGNVNGRVNNMNAMRNGQVGIKVCTGKKTLEYQICSANVFARRAEIQETWLYELIKRDNAEDIAKVEVYMITLGERDMTEEEQQNVALLLWKCLSGKAGFAQHLNSFLLDKIEAGDEVKFRVPVYIQDAINHLIP